MIVKYFEFDADRTPYYILSLLRNKHVVTSVSNYEL